MAANPVPLSKLELTTDRTPAQITVRCTGRITSDTETLLKDTVKPLLPQSPSLRLDLSNVSYLDSSGLGAIVGLYVSAKSAGCRLKCVNLTQRLKELFSITRVGEFLAEGHDPSDVTIP